MSRSHVIRGVAGAEYTRVVPLIIARPRLFL
jgi:hypothetical protein